MTDFWSFLLQTLTASGAAALLLLVKLMFRDKLSPRWQFAVWGVLALVLLTPAGLGGRYALFNWPLFVELQKSALTGDYGTLTRVLAPIPLPSFTPPKTAADWLYLIYLAGVILLVARYVVSYVRLRLALKKGRPVQGPRLQAVAEEYGLPTCPSVEVDGLSTAFICGLFRPVLALPNRTETDDKVVLHELLHLKYRDVAWGWVIAFFRCVHWCNPLLWLCADWAGNDLESLCDQRVLEHLEGEERRDYGRILLSMADERYARAPGTSSAANGGRNIARRIQAIARFKRYPTGMGLASVCVALLLAIPLVVGVKAQTVGGRDDFLVAYNSPTAYLTSGRTVRCTTCHGALDAYAKFILTGNLPYRAMCAPLSEQNELAAAAGVNTYSYLHAKYGLPGAPEMGAGYQVYNLTEVDGDVFEGLLMVKLIYPPEGAESVDHYWWLSTQPLRAEKQGGRWVVIPQGQFRAFQSIGWASMPSSCGEVPAKVYEAQTGDFTVRVRCQTILRPYGEGPEDRWHFGAGSPQPDAEFYVSDYQECMAVYIGDPAEMWKYTHIAASGIALWKGDPRPALKYPGPGDSAGSSTTGAAWGSKPLGEDWDGTVWLFGGGGSDGGDRGFPDSYALDLYLNGKLAAELTLLPLEGGAWVDE